MSGKVLGPLVADPHVVGILAALLGEQADRAPADLDVGDVPDVVIGEDALQVDNSLHLVLSSDQRIPVLILEGGGTASAERVLPCRATYTAPLTDRRPASDE